MFFLLTPNLKKKPQIIEIRFTQWYFCLFFTNNCLAFLCHILCWCIVHRERNHSLLRDIRYLYLIHTKQCISIGIFNKIRTFPTLPISHRFSPCLPCEKWSEMALDFMVIPLSCSSSRLSIYLNWKRTIILPQKDSRLSKQAAAWTNSHLN